MKFSTTLSFLILLSSLVPEIVIAQKNQINILPARIFYNNINEKFDFGYGSQYVELEHKLNNKLSINFGFGYKRRRDEVFNASSKDNLTQLTSDVKYYLNTKNNMSGFYGGSGLNYFNINSLNSGRYASSDLTLAEDNTRQNVVYLNLNLGYKYCLLKNRFSIDLRLVESTSVYNRTIEEEITVNNVKTVRKRSFDNFKINYPFLDLRLGYRFGFKK
jgi:hypothetical protein